MSISHEVMREQAIRRGVNMAFEQALREFNPVLHDKEADEYYLGMSQLIDEHGTRGAIVTSAFALYWIGLNPEWTREEL